MTGGPDNRFLYLVEDHGEVLLRAARVLCGDWAQAEDLLQTALSRSLARWEAGLSDEEWLVAVRQEVVTACLESFPDHHETTFRSTAEPPGSLLAQLHELDPIAHAALVAMYYLDLTAWQAADAIGSVPSHTADIVERCLAWLDTPEETFQVQIDTELGPTPPSPADRLEWVTRGATPERPSHGRHGQGAAPLTRLSPRVAAALTVALLSTSLAAALLLNAGDDGNDRHESTPTDSVEVDTVPTLPERVPAASTLTGTSTAPTPSNTPSTSPTPSIVVAEPPPGTGPVVPPPAQQPTTRPPSQSSSPRPPASSSPKPKPTPPRTTKPPTPTTPPPSPTTPPTSPTPTPTTSDPGQPPGGSGSASGSQSTGTPTNPAPTTAPGAAVPSP